MSFVFATPEYVAAAASDLARIGWTITSANSMALGPTSSVLAPGADEVSTSIATLFDAHSQVYQALSAQAAAFHNQFVELMNGGTAQYLATEAANASPLQSAAAPASMAAQLPAATAAGGTAPGVPAAPLMSAVAPASAIAGAPTPASPAVAAGPAALAPSATPTTPVRMVTPAYAPAAAAQAAAPARMPVSSLAAAPAQLETPQAAAAPAMPVSTGTPVKVVAPHSPTTAAPAGSAARPAAAIVPKVD